MKTLAKATQVVEKPPEPLAVRETSNGAAEPAAVMLLHGFTGSSTAWGEALLKELSEGRRVIAVDLPGHGEAPIPMGVGRTFETVVDLLVATLDTRGILRADWIGYSMGGRLALAAAVRHPERVRRLVLESASPGLETEVERTTRQAEDEELACQIEERGIEWFVGHWENLPMFETQGSLPQPLQEAVRARRLACDPRGLAGALRTLGTGSQPSYWAELKDLEVPTLILSGTLDAKFVDIALRMRRLMPDAEYVPVPGAGHAVHLEVPSAWLGAVRGFLDRA